MKQIRLIRNVNLGIKSLLLHKLRSMLTMLGVVFGVGSVVAMLSVGEGANQEAIEQIRKLGSNNIIIRTVKPVEEQGSQTNQRSRVSAYGIEYADWRRAEVSYPHVERIVPARILDQEARVGKRAMNVRVVGTTPDWFELVPRPLLAGRRFSWQDMKSNAGVVVLAEEAARYLLATRDPIGQSVRIGGEYFEVIGIIETQGGSGGGGVQTPDRAIDAYIPLNVVRERWGETIIKRSSGSRQIERVELQMLIAQVDEIQHVAATASAIRTGLSRFHDKADFNLAVPLALLRQAQATQRLFNIVLGSIAGISLLVGGIGIMNIMLASVTERTREIGVRRAIGAKRRQIIGQFLIETIVLSRVGGLIGVVLGVSIPWAITYFADMPTVVTTWSVVLSLTISVAVGVIFGLYPAYRAAALDPIIALRHE